MKHAFMKNLFCLAAFLGLANIAWAGTARKDAVERMDNAALRWLTYLPAEDVIVAECVGDSSEGSKKMAY